MEHIRGSIYVEHITPGCNVGIVATSRGTLISDTPLLRRRADRIRQDLAAQGEEPVRLIHYTDHHHDHILGGGLFGEDVIVLARKGARERQRDADPKIVADWVKTWPWDDSADPEEILSARPPLPDVCYEGEAELHLGGVYMVMIPLPGHVPETCGVLFPAERILFSGDAVFHENHPYMGDANLGVWAETLEKILALDVDTILPGHGPLCTKDAVGKLKRYMQRVRNVRAEWDPAHGWDSAPRGVRDEIESIIEEYPLYSRSRDYMRERVIQSVAVSASPRF